MTKFSNLKIIILFFIFSFLFYSKTMAAKLQFTSQVTEIGVGGGFKVDLSLDSESADVNAAEGKIVFPEDFLELKGIYDGNSIVNFWVQKPVYEFGNGVIFSGVIPGGFSGVFGYSGEKKPGKLLSLLFSAKKAGVAEIKIADAKSLLNDGKGTETALSTSGLKIAISAGGVSASLKEIKDSDPPEPFSPEIAASPSLFNGRWFLAFAAQDKVSGIDHYEIQEIAKREPKTGGFIRAESPYVLKDQSLSSYIFVKAVDKAGNVRAAYLPPRFAVWYKNPLVDMIIGIVFLIVILLIQRLLKKIKGNFFAN